MRVHSVLIAFAIWRAASAASASLGSGGAAGRSEAPATEESRYIDLCRGEETCRQAVLVRRDGVLLLRVSFLHPARFVDEDQDYCDAREYWHIKGKDRLLLARDCAEQSGPDSQGPVQVTFNGKQLELEYIEWQANDGCERSLVAVDWQTAKVGSGKRWTGQSRANRTVCGRQKIMKAAVRIGAGTASDPLIMFHH